MSVKLPLEGQPNVGPATARDLQRLGISSLDQLKGQDPREMYDRLCELTGLRQDPCVLDTFKAVVHNSRTGERRMWWTFTPERKG